MCGVGELFSSPPMSSKTTSKCLHCKEEYHADPRNCGRQRHCLKPDCRQASKATSQRQWLSRPENRDYFRGSENCERVRLWRLAHPGYWRNKRPAPQSVLQEPLISQAVANEQVVNPAAASVLQEILFSQPAMFVGLISVLTGSGLQEDIAESARSFLNRGEDILRMVPGSPPFPSHENQARPVPRTLAARPPPI
jgi:primosomal protein N'